MPSGIILSSGSKGATQEDIEKVLEKNGYETEKPTTEVVELVEPKRDDFESDDAFETAQEEFETKQEAAAELEEAVEEEKETKKQEQREQQQKQPTRRQRAIAKATKDLREELRKSNERLAALEGKGGRREPEAVTVKAPEAPKRDKFPTDAAYEEAMFDYRYQLRRVKEQTEEAQKSVERQQKENLESYQTQVAAFKEEHDDWDKVVNQPIPIHEGVQLAIIEMENGAEVTYYLGKHPDYTRDLADMSPLKAIREIGRLADKLAGPKPVSGTQPKPKPKALPEPVKALSTSATSSTLSSREAAKNRDFRAFKAAQSRGV